MKHSALSHLSVAIALILATPTTSDEQALITLIQRLNSDVIELRNEIESSYANRCDTINGCSRTSYDECQSEMTAAQTCPSLSELGYAVPECGRGETCNALFNYELTTVRLPANAANGPNRNPTNPMVVEAICSSRTAESWMVNKYKDAESFWRSLGVDSPQMYFGSATGMFRIFPARQSRECGQYDPRDRPWYKGAVPQTLSNTVKPRHVVMLLDRSLSMGDPMSPKSNQTKLAYMKNVVTSTLRLLTDKDSVAVITFDETASVSGNASALPPYYWMPASTENIQRLVNEVNGMVALGRSNWMEGFDAAFNLIDSSLEQIATNGTHDCMVENVALLFFSDGGMNLPVGITDQQVTEFVADRIESAESLNNEGLFKIYPFFYSIANSDPEQVAKSMSCLTGGIWKPLTEEMGASNATGGYQTLFSIPMGTDTFLNFTTWSDPYTFSSSGKTGYTVSALVYDRNIEPPRFIGAVGMDVLVAAAQKVYGGTEEQTEAAIKRITTYISNANFDITCDEQAITLSFCELQSLRHFSGGRSSLCIPDATTFANASATPAIDDSTLTNDRLETNTTTTPSLMLALDLEDGSSYDLLKQLNCTKAFAYPCPGKDEYPKNMWNNINLQGQSFEERVCCEVGTNVVSSQCPKLDEIASLGLSNEMIFAFIFVPLAIIELVGCYCCFYRKRKRGEHEEDGL